MDKVRGYGLICDSDVVYIGVSNNLCRRLQEHQESGKKFDLMTILTPDLERELALKWESQMLWDFRCNFFALPYYIISRRLATELHWLISTPLTT